MNRVAEDVAKKEKSPHNSMKIKREMKTMIAKILITLIALLHVYFLVLEMFLWDKPIGMKAFGNNAEKAKLTKVLAQNQGLYN